MRIGMTLAVMLAIDIFLFIAQAGITAVSAEVGATNIYYHESKSIISTIDQNSSVSSQLPQGNPVEDSSGVSIDNLWNIIKSWLFSIPGVSFVSAMVTALPQFLNILGFPQSVAWALGAFWHGLTLLLLIVFLRGGTEI